MKSQNFEFLPPENDALVNLGGLAEAVLHVDPGNALTRLRSFAEEFTKAVYKEEGLPRLPQSSFFELVKNPVFEDCVSKSLINQINFLRIQGNDTAHGAEAKTRTRLIDLMLEQAGWDTTNSDQVGQEVEVEFPNNPSGKGKVDYVLWGDNGQPLAVIEAKKSGNTSLQAGREQARLYADALEKMGYQRPVIFYTNGYETFIWDDVYYTPTDQCMGSTAKRALSILYTSDTTVTQN